MKIVVDLNLSPLWGEALLERGIEAVHWSTVGDPAAKDQVILAWALSESRIVLTSDLDFGRLLALTYARGPSVVLLRFRDLFPEAALEATVEALQSCSELLRTGALLVVDAARWRARVLPLER